MKRMAKHSILHLFILWLLLIASHLVKGQDMINEDFLDNIETNAKFILEETAPAFSINAVPDKWKKESASVIGYKRSILFDKKSS